MIAAERDRKLPREYYLNDDVVFLARDLLGKLLVTQIGGHITAGMIQETEAYAGTTDRASHAYGGRRTPRTRVMYREGGISYVYLCYGIHYLFNIVTAPVETPHAVLIRGVYPMEGRETMLDRRGTSTFSDNFSNGPGKLTKALGINMAHNGISLIGDVIWLEETDVSVDEHDVRVSGRIGVEYAAEDALLPYRFTLDARKYIAGGKH